MAGCSYRRRQGCGGERMQLVLSGGLRVEVAEGFDEGER